MIVCGYEYYFCKFDSIFSEEQCEKWSSNADSFVEDEDEDSFAYSVRISSQDLLTALFRKTMQIRSDIKRSILRREYRIEITF